MKNILIFLTVRKLILRKRLLLLQLLTIAAFSLSGCNSITWSPNPVIEIRLNAPVSSVQKKSTYKFPAGFLEGSPGAEFVKVPHKLIYRDADLHLEIENAGALPSLATMLGYSIRLSDKDPESVINYFTVALLQDYSTASVAFEKVNKLAEELKKQGFELEAPWKPSLSKIPERNPTEIHTLDDLKEVFLNPYYFLKESRVYTLKKNNIKLSIEIENTRRKLGSSADTLNYILASLEKRSEQETLNMTRQNLVNEASYMVRLDVGSAAP